MSTARQANQIVNQGTLYATGGQIGYVSNTAVTVNAGQFRDYTNQFDINLGNYLNANPNAPAANVITTLNSAVIGVNGLDKGTLATSVFYYVYVIGDSTGYMPTAVIASLNAPNSTPQAGPYLPQGYNVWRRIGQFLTDGSAHIRPFNQVGSKEFRSYQYTNEIGLYAGAGSTSYVNLPVNGAIPNDQPTNAYLSLSINPATAGNSLSVSPGVQTTGTGVVVSGTTTGQIMIHNVKSIVTFNAGTPPLLSLSYVSTSASDALTISVTGYDDFI